MRKHLIGMLFIAPLALTLTACDDDPLILASADLLAVTQAATGAQKLVAFNRQTPGTLTQSTLITGTALVTTNADVIIGLDVRPADGALIALGRNGTAARLYTVNPTTGVSTLLCTLVTGAGATAVTLGAADSYGADFNPTALAGNALRVVSSAGQNLRVETRPATALATNIAGANQCATATDATLNTVTAGVSATRTGVSAAAYTNSVSGSSATALYYIDSAADRLAISTDPNGGLVGNVGGTAIAPPLGADITGVNGFEISSSSGAATLVAQVGTATSSTLYNVNLLTGIVTELGTVGGGELIAGVTTRP